MTREESLSLAAEIESAITGEGQEYSSGYFQIFRRRVGKFDCVGMVDVVAGKDMETGAPEYNVYSIANEVDGDMICEPEWDQVEGSAIALADFLYKLANEAFRLSELVRLTSYF